MSKEIKEVDAYKIFKQLEERKKRATPYTFYDKDELIDEILKQEDGIEDLQQKVEQLEKENKRLKEWKDDLLSENIELENIRKEAIEEIQRVLDIWTNKPNEIATLDLEYLLNILNKGDNNVKD